MKEERIENEMDDPLGESLTEDDPLGDDYLYNDGLTDDFGMGTDLSPLKKHQDLLKELTNFDPYVRDAFNAWLGIKWDEDKKQYVGNPLIVAKMNLMGASWSLGFLKTYVRGNNIMTNLTAQQFIDLQEDMIDTVYLNVGLRTEEFGIRNDGDMITIANQLLHSAQLMLMGAEDGKYTKFLGTSYQHSTHSTYNPQVQQQQGQVATTQPNRSSGGILGMFRKQFGGGR